MAGIFAAACVGLTVSAVAEKVRLSTQERYVIDAMKDMVSNRSLRSAYANIIRAAYLKYSAKKRGNTRQVTKYNRELLKAISAMHDARADMLDVQANAVSLIDVIREQQDVAGTLQNIQADQYEVKTKLMNLENLLKDLKGPAPAGQGLPVAGPSLPPPIQLSTMSSDQHPKIPYS